MSTRIEDLKSEKRFPLNGLGTMMIRRKKKMVGIIDEVLDKFENDDLRTHQWRGLPGSGKTSMLLALGQELESRGGYAVYFGIGDYFKSDKLPELIKRYKDQGKKFVLLLDEVTKVPNKDMLTVLGKGKPLDMLVLGAGIYSLNDPTMQFNITHDAGDQLLDEDDMDELVEYIKTDDKSDKSDKVMTGDALKEVVYAIRELTGGHAYPCVKMVEYIIYGKEYKGEFNVNSVTDHLSSLEFSNCISGGQINNRCFGGLNDISEEVRLYLSNKLYSSEQLVRRGILYKVNGKMVFISNYFASFCLNKFEIKELGRGEDFADNDTPEVKAEKIIAVGLRYMEHSDFYSGQTVKHENGIGFSWAYNVRSVFPDVYIYAQPKTPGNPRSIVDFYINSRLNLAVELVLSASRYEKEPENSMSIQTKLGKFQEGGVYDCYENPVVLNFELHDKEAVVSPTLPTQDVYVPANEKEQLPAKCIYKFNESDANKVVTFDYHSNKLYRGKSIIRNNVVDSFARQFSTYRTSQHINAGHPVVGVGSKYIPFVRLLRKCAFKF